MRAGRLIVLAYLFCVLAPSLALAFGASIPCVTDEVYPVATAHVHETAVAHADAGASHDHGGLHAHHAADPAGTPAKHSHDGNSSPGPCCAMMCATAMPADLPSIVTPSEPVSTRLFEPYRVLRSETPARLYRPPIA